MPLATAVNIFFHLYMIFLAAYSGLTIFALIRYGQSRLFGFLLSLLYIMLVSSLYFQTLTIITKL